jgi:accessory gene regulator protein AgrB
MLGVFIIIGKLLLIGIVSLLPIFLFAWFQGRIRSKRLWLASLVAIGLAFFLFAFLGYSLDPKYGDVPLVQRLRVSLLVATVLALAIAVIQPVLYRLVPSLFRSSSLGSRAMRKMRQRHPEEVTGWEERLGVSVDEEADGPRG